MHGPMASFIHIVRVLFVLLGGLQCEISHGSKYTNFFGFYSDTQQRHDGIGLRSAQR